MSDEQKNEKIRVEKIAKLNDLARTAMGVACRLVQTIGVSSLPEGEQSQIRELVELYSNWTSGNNPHGERDFGVLFGLRTDTGANKWTQEPQGSKFEGPKIFFKIDYYDRALKNGSEDPTNTAVTTRVLTIMLAEEY